MMGKENYTVINSIILQNPWDDVKIPVDDNTLEWINIFVEKFNECVQLGFLTDKKTKEEQIEICKNLLPLVEALECFLLHKEIRNIIDGKNFENSRDKLIQYKMNLDKYKTS